MAGRVVAVAAVLPRLIGDYLGVAAGGGKVFGVWAGEARSDEQVVQDAQGKPSKLHLMVDVGFADFSTTVSVP